jgi:hypothetical protein
MDSSSTNVPVLDRGCGYKGAHSVHTYLAPIALLIIRLGALLE